MRSSDRHAMPLMSLCLLSRVVLAVSVSDGSISVFSCQALSVVLSILLGFVGPHAGRAAWLTARLGGGAQVMPAFRVLRLMFFSKTFKHLLLFTASSITSVLNLLLFIVVVIVVFASFGVLLLGLPPLLLTHFLAIR